MVFDPARAARRAVVLSQHPDRGGDVDAFVRAMAALEDRPHRQHRPTVTPTPRWRRRVRTTLRRVRGLRTRLPRSFPGARRYVEL